MINKLAKDGILRKLAGAGLLAPKTFLYRNVYLEYDKKRKLGVKKLQAITDTAEEFKVSERLVYRAKRVMENI